MNIGLLTTYFAGGTDCDSGIGQHYRFLADALVAEGHRVHVVYIRPQWATDAQTIDAQDAGWTIDVVPTSVPRVLLRLVGRRWPLQLLLENMWSARAAAHAVIEGARRHSFEVLETHSYNSPALFLLSKRNRPRVITRVSTTARQANAYTSIHSKVLGWHAELERRAIQRSDALLTHTHEHRDLVCAQEHCRPSRFNIVPHGLPDPGSPPPFAGTNTSGEIEFLYVGRFEARKGTDVLLAAIPEVARTLKHVVFTLAGSVGDGAMWRTFAHEHPQLVSSRVCQLGRVSNAILAELYRRCAVLVAPSRYESFGLVYPEAMSRGKPVIGCAAGGIPEVVADGVTGLLAKPGDRQSLADAMIRLAQDTDLRRQFGAAGRKRFEDRFSAVRMAASSVAVYRELLARQ